ncbi:MAG TPA: hypothetical protein VIV11_36760, partial [Kofleriaceae bacterium]
CPDRQRPNPRGRLIEASLFAVNAPVRWHQAEASVAASAYVGVARHYAIRLNVATYPHTGLAKEAYYAFQGVGGETAYSGRTTDVGIGAMMFPRKLWSGISFELGALRRVIDVREQFDYQKSEARKGAGIVGRALVGWSWLFGDRVFVATGVGMSIGRYALREDTIYMDPGYPAMDEGRNVVVFEPSFEGYFRIGIAATL